MNVYSEISDLVRCELIMFIFKPQWVDLGLFSANGGRFGPFCANGGRFGPILTPQWVDLALFSENGVDLEIINKKRCEIYANATR